KRAVLRSVGGKLVDGQSERLRSLVIETQRRPLDDQPAVLRRVERLYLRFEQGAQVNAGNAAGNQKVGGAGKTRYALLERVLKGCKVPGAAAGLLGNRGDHRQLVLRAMRDLAHEEPYLALGLASIPRRL